MKTIVAVPHRPTGESRKSGAAGTDAEWLAMKPAQEPEAANRHIRFDFVTSIWCGAMVGCIGAAVIPPFSESGRRGTAA
jgi:hypothetical protein